MITSLIIISRLGRFLFLSLIRLKKIDKVHMSKQR